MGSFKFTIKQQNRNKLYYSKFRYRAELREEGVRFVFGTKTLKKCFERIDKFNNLMAIARLFAGLSFAAVCFDESRNIWFRVVAVAALMLIMFGGLNIM